MLKNNVSNGGNMVIVDEIQLVYMRGLFFAWGFIAFTAFFSVANGNLEVTLGHCGGLSNKFGY